VSDIAITFPWPVLVAAVLLIGWPGFLLGGTLGLLVWRAHRIIGGVVGAFALDLLWAYAWLEL
jgi:hypothetical protein